MTFTFNHYFDMYYVKLTFSSQYVDSFNKLLAFLQSFTVSLRVIDRNRVNIFKQFSEHPLAIYSNHQSQAFLQ